MACTAPFSLPIAGALVALSVLQGLSSYIFTKIIDTNNPLLLQTTAAITSIALGAFCLPLLGSTLSLHALVIITPKMIVALGACHLALRAIYTSLSAVLKRKATAPLAVNTPNPTSLKKVQGFFFEDTEKMQTVKKVALITAGALLTAAIIYVGWSYFSSNPATSSTQSSSTLKITPSILSSNSSLSPLSDTSSFTWTPFMYGSIFLSIALGISLLYKKREKEIPPLAPSTSYTPTSSVVTSLSENFSSNMSGSSAMQKDPSSGSKPSTCSSVSSSSSSQKASPSLFTPNKLLPTVIGNFHIFNEQTQTLEEYEQLQTMGDGACGLHAILGKPILIAQEITIGYLESEAESASKAVRTFFAQELQKAFETRMDSLQDSWEKMLVGLVKEYIKDQDPSPELHNLLGLIHEDLFNLKKGIEAIQAERQKLVEDMHQLLEQAKQGPLIQALLAAYPTKQLANLVEEHFEERIKIISEDSADLAVALRENKNRRIALAQKEEENIAKFCNSDVAKKGYIEGIKHINYRLSREEVCFAGEVLHKRVSVCSRASPLEIEILQGKGEINNPSVVVFYENGHFSLCQRKEEVTAN